MINIGFINQNLQCGPEQLVIIPCLYISYLRIICDIERCLFLKLRPANAETDYWIFFLAMNESLMLLL